jgi:hypothetical protein
MGARRVSSLLQVQSRTWQAEYTSDLIDLLNVLGLLEELEPRQVEFLDAVLTGPLVNGQDLPTATVQFAGTSPASDPPIAQRLQPNHCSSDQIHVITNTMDRGRGRYDSALSMLSACRPRCSRRRGGAGAI